MDALEVAAKRLVVVVLDRLNRERKQGILDLEVTEALVALDEVLAAKKVRRRRGLRMGYGCAWCGHAFISKSEATLHQADCYGSEAHEAAKKERARA